MTRKSEEIQQEETYEASDTHKVTRVGDARLFGENDNGQIVERYLIPCPTEDPADPLTWDTWRKHLAMASTCFFVFMSNYATGSITPVLLPIVLEFKISLDQASYLITCNILTLGLGNLFWVPLAQKYGKRPVLIICAALFFGSTIWSAVANSYGSLLGARIIQGWAASASEALGVAIAADLYFLHERGAKVGLYTFMIAVGAALGSIFAGLIANATPAWRWVFWFNAILTGILLLLTIGCLVETNFKRPVIADREGISQSEYETMRRRLQRNTWAAFSVTGWYDRETPLWRLFLRPLLLTRLPAVIWASVIYGIVLGWVVLQTTANATAFPVLYGFSSLGVGNINIANVIGAVFGCLYGGPVSDRVVQYISKRHSGEFQPEHRLWCLIPPFLLGPVGLLIWGFGLGLALNEYVAIAGTGIAYGVVCAVPSIGMTYVVDSYKPLDADVITILTAFKNTFAFGISFAVTPWTTTSGFAGVGGYLTLIEGIFFLTTIPMFIYGARLRDWSQQKFQLW